jgi:membrane-associated phospholipid phosphatase
MLVPYWQTGQFFIEPNEKIQSWLAALDRRWLGSLAARAGTARTRIGLSMEIAYFLCYPLVPLGLGVMFAAGLRNHTDAYWRVVLISTYICYAITPFVPALPPSTMATAQLISSMPPGKGRMLNQWLHRHGSIHAISFPSAHVASALAVSLVLLRFVPFAGLLFLIVSIWIAVAAVVGRYHYALDVLLGAVVALGTFLASYPSL